MATTVKIHTRVTLEGEPGVAEDAAVKYEWDKSVTGLVRLKEINTTIASDATVTLWDPTDPSEDVDTFDVLFLVADGALDLELVANNGDANEELFTVRLQANTPFVLGADDSYYNHSANNAFGGSLDVIDLLRVDEPASAARVLRGWIGAKS